MDIPIIFAVRKQSQRCSDKILRPFHDGQNLLQIAVQKFRGNPLVYIAAHEPEFKLIADKFNVSFAQRTIESALSEEVLEIHGYLLGMPYKYACLVNACCPILKAETINKAIGLFKADEKILSMFSVTESHDILFDSDKNLINSDKVFNSKIRRPSYIGNNAFIIFDIKKLFSKGSYWNYEVNDPYLFNTSRVESVDIDTVEDFEIAQTLYARYNTST